MKLVNTNPNLSYDVSSMEIQVIRRLHLSDDVISSEVSQMFCLINFVILSVLISSFGIFTNTINMIVFYRQGFNTTTNISLFALALSDMLSLVTAQWTAICINPSLRTANIQFIFEELQYLTGGWFHVCFGRITSWITVFITAERCLGITMPLKVKQIVSVRRTTISMCIIFVGNLGGILPEYRVAYLGWKFVEARNCSLFGLVYRSNINQASGLTFIITSASGIMSFVFVIMLTTFLVSSLERKSQWRMKATQGSQKSDSKSTRNKKTMKMIIMIASILIVCYIPGITLTLATAFVPEFTIDLKFSNSFYAFHYLAFVFDAINSSVNVFLYYRMSTKYRQTFHELFKRCLKSDLC